MIKPTGYSILVKPDPVETTTAGGIVLAVDEGREAAGSVTGTVMDVGELAWKILVDGVIKQAFEPYARIGDRIQYRRYTGVSVKDVDGQEYFLMNDDDVLGRWDKDNEHV